MSNLIIDLSSNSSNQLIEPASNLVMYPSSTLMACSGTTRMNRHQLSLIPTPTGTKTHKPIPHIEIVNALIETLGFRKINVIGDEYAISHDGMRMFGLLNLSLGFDGCHFAIGLRNGNDKSMRLALTVGYKVHVCSNMAFDGDFTPVLAKHSAKFSIEDALAIGVDKIQRNFEPLRNQIEMWRNIQLSDLEAKNVIYTAFIQGELEAPKSLINMVHSLYFEPIYPEFMPRTFWSLSNAFTSAFKDLNPSSQFQATAKLGDFLNKFFPKPKK